MKAPIAAVAAVAALLLAGCAGSPDRQGDALSPEEQRAGWTIVIDLLDRRVSYHVTSDPTLLDTDGDGLTDWEEFQYGADPRKADTVGNGLTDCQEAKHTVREECEDPDFDGPFDGGTGTDPAKWSSIPGPSRFMRDHVDFVDETGTLRSDHLGRPVPWGAGISDGELWDYWTARLERAEREYREAGHIPESIRERYPEANDTELVAHFGPHGDLDGDGIANIRDIDPAGDGLEVAEALYLYGADPSTPDTNGNGCLDGRDPIPHAPALYAAGLRSLTLHGEDGEEHEVRLRVTVARNILDVPGADSNLTVRAGEVADLAGVSPEPVPFTDCDRQPRITPWHPWMDVRVEAWRVDAEGNRTPLDLASRTEGFSGHLEWNVRDGTFAWDGFDPDGARLPLEDGVLALHGADGELRLRPHVVLPPDRPMPVPHIPWMT